LTMLHHPYTAVWRSASKHKGRSTVVEAVEAALILRPTDSMVVEVVALHLRTSTPYHHRQVWRIVDVEDVGVAMAEAEVYEDAGVLHKYNKSKFFNELEDLLDVLSDLGNG